jgi:hypothetical protein
MTSAAERIREQHRGARLAAPASVSRLAALETFGLRYDRVDEFNVIVEGDYQLNLAMSFWRANDGSAQGYLVSALNEEIKRRFTDGLVAMVPEGTTILMVDTFNSISEKPVAGRNSVAAGDRELTVKPPAAVAESVTGPNSLLPAVNQWP